MKILFRKGAACLESASYYRAWRMKIAFLTTDNREVWKDYARTAPVFGPAPGALVSGFEGISGLEVHVISCIRQPVKSPEKLAGNIWFHSLTVPQLGWMRTGYLGCILAVRRKLREIKPDLVHGQGTELESGICGAFSGYPNVMTLLGVMKEMAEVFQAKPGSFYWCASLLESLALRRTIGVVANSHFTEACVRDRTAKTWLVANALRKEFLETPSAASSQDGMANRGNARRVVMNIGTITSYKRQLELLDMAEKLRGEGVELHWRFVGAATPGNAYPDRFRRRIEGQDWVSWQKSLSTEEIIAELDQSVAMVHVSAIESFGLVVAEALARNVKFFGFGIAGVNDIAAGVEGAEVFADNDWAALQGAVSRWAKAGCPRPKTAAATMRERYHPKVIAAEHVELYREVIRSKTGKN